MEQRKSGCLGGCAVCRAAPFTAHSPSGENVGERGDVALCVAAIDPKGVQLHHLAGVVFVGSAALVLAAVKPEEQAWEASAELAL